MVLTPTRQINPSAIPPVTSPPQPTTQNAYNTSPGPSEQEIVASLTAGTVVFTEGSDGRLLLTPVSETIPVGSTPSTLKPPSKVVDATSALSGTTGFSVTVDNGGSSALINAGLTNACLTDLFYQRLKQDGVPVATPNGNTCPGLIVEILDGSAGLKSLTALTINIYAAVTVGIVSAPGTTTGGVVWQDVTPPWVVVTFDKDAFLVGVYNEIDRFATTWKAENPTAK